MDWYLEVMRKYAVFSGRARRKEYWMFQLVNIIIFAAVFAAVIPPLFAHRRSPASLLLLLFAFVYALATIIPGLAVSVRRLHDINFSGWWILLAFVPSGGLILLVFHVLDSTPGTNRYGPNPKGVGVSPYGRSYPSAASQAMAAGAGSSAASRPMVAFCTTCGAPMPLDATSCLKCGNPVR